WTAPFQARIAFGGGGTDSDVWRDGGLSWLAALWIASLSVVLRDVGARGYPQGGTVHPGLGQAQERDSVMPLHLAAHSGRATTGCVGCSNQGAAISPFRAPVA